MYHLSNHPLYTDKKKLPESQVSKRLASSVAQKCIALRWAWLHLPFAADRVDRCDAATRLSQSGKLTMRSSIKRTL